MEYQVVKNEHSNRKWKDKKKQAWSYITTADAEKTELDLTKVFADIGDEQNNNGDKLYFLGRTLMLNNVKSTLSGSEKVVGYIPCKSNEGEEGYVRIIEKKRKKMLLPLILIFALLVGGGIWWALNRQPKVDLDKEAIAYQMPNGMKNENPNEIMIPVFSELTMKTGKNKVEAGLVNPEGNPCYFKYQIYLKEGNKLLYESKWLEPGTAIVEIEIKEKFEVGSYPITISVKTGSLKDPEVEMNGGEVETILKVE